MTTTAEEPSTSRSEPQVPDDDQTPALQLLPLQGLSCTVDGHCD